MGKERVDNYERQCEMWRQRFLTMDQSALMRRLPELRAEGDYLTLRHFGRRLGVHRTEGHISPMDDDEPLTLDERLNVYTLMEYCRGGAHQTGEWLPFERLRDASPFGPAFHKMIHRAFAEAYCGRADVLRAALERLGGLKLRHGDVGYQLDAFRCIPVRFLFWDGDDEFPAQANLLFDAGSTDFIHVESIVSIASQGLTRIAWAAARVSP